MLKNYFKIAYRNLTRSKVFTVINILGLAVGIVGGLLISLFIYDELSFDKMFADSDRIYRLNIDNRTAGETNKYASVPGPLAATLVQDCPPVEMVTRFRGMGSILLRKVDAEKNVKETHVVGADSNFFKMFGLELLVGDKKTALKEPNTLILTKTAAEKHFPLSKAVGQRLLLDNENVYVVSGVIDDMPKNSFLRNYTVFISIESFDDAKSIAWNIWNFPTFVKLFPEANPEDLQAFLNAVPEKYLIPWAMTFVPGLTVESAKAAAKKSGDFMRFSAMPLTDIHLYSSDREREFSPNSTVQNVYILSIIGFFLILLACVNFMNLSTAHSLKRAKEVGIRKTIGSNRLGIISQFLSEAVLISFLSLFIAITMAEIAMPFFNELANKAISIPLSNPFFWLMLVAVVALLGLLSGFYPAFFMSRFIPIEVLKGGGQTGGSNGKIRNSLVVFQFVISVSLIGCTLVIYQQINFIQNKDLGYQKNQILIIDDVYTAGNQIKSFKHEVQQLGQVQSVSLSSFLPTPSDRRGVTYFPEGKGLQTRSAVIIENWEIDHDYVSTLNLEIIAGRDFNKQFTTDSTSIILNESAVAMMGMQPEEAIGVRLTKDFHRPDKENMKYETIIGVVKNFHFESLRNNVGGLSLSMGNNPNRMIAKLNAGDYSNIIANIEKIWETVAPGQPFNYYFLDESFNDVYKSELRLGSIFLIFTILSIFVACLGLFGLTIFNVEKRTKEIGVRKVLGATVSNLLFMLTKDFTKWILIANVIAWPIAWYAMKMWLQNFAYRIDMSWWMFVLSGGIALLIAILTVGFQAIKAATANPVKSLRNE